MIQIGIGLAFLGLAYAIGLIQGRYQKLGGWFPKKEEE